MLPTVLFPALLPHAVAPIGAVAPECAADAGSWCARVWSWTGMSWLARGADTTISVLFSVIAISVVAVLVRLVVSRIIGHVAAGAGVPGLMSVLRRKRGVTDAESIEAFGSARRAQRAKTVGSVLRSAATILIFGTAFMMVLSRFGVNLAPVLASAGVLGLAVGFGAQNLVKDFISGIFMLLEDQYGVGDHVDLGDAVGTIERVGLRTTSVRDVSGVVWYVRNGTIERVGNASQDHAVAVVDVPLELDTDVEEAGRVAEKAAQAAVGNGLARDIIDPPRVLGVQSVSESALTLRLTTKTRPNKQWAVKRAITERVVSDLRASSAGNPTAAASQDATTAA
ncbi:mechanosensitive ion channel family protein [Actinomycetospora endophytica]|uniref:Mechanosensitive ion channel family protein n=1 Tax=Actinomycetospora endophytica TaxID=2291215 RepID=A0ABS8P480_9PSEU|nr:mechanosensitive ion channel family protein [Actinomycetospora endophytica]MCD2193041.1 mechanosensitive ion channel family protein [Actinomycetospora endophytica]